MNILVSQKFIRKSENPKAKFLVPGVSNVFVKKRIALYHAFQGEIVWAQLSAMSVENLSNRKNNQEK